MIENTVQRFGLSVFLTNCRASQAWRKAGYFILPVFLVLFSLSLPEQSQSTLAYDRALILQGEWWLAVTGQLTHANSIHGVVNALALAAILLLLPHHARKFVLPITLAIMTLVGVFLLSQERQLQYYVGFSAALHGLLIFLAYTWLTIDKRVSGLLFASLALKLVYEMQFYEVQSIDPMIQMRIATEAHFWGGIAGAVVVAGTYTFNLSLKKTDTTE